MRRYVLLILFVLLLAALPAAAQAATLYFSPSSGSHDIGSDFNVTVGVNTAGVAINAAQATVSFPTNLLEVRGVAKSGTLTLWPIEPSYSNSSGTISFAGGLPNPGYTGSGGSIITITFRGKAEGTASVTLGSASVLKNDGLGTNVYSGSNSGLYTITAPAPPPPEKPLPLAPVISSTTHPDQNLWYASANPSFSWSKQSGVTAFSYSLDDQERKTPDTISEGALNSKNFTAVGDGTWYFHVRAQNENGWGPAAHFQIRIDTTPPLPFEIKSLDGNPARVRRPRMSFSTTDATSGVHHYSLKINDGVIIEIDADATEPYTLSELSNGTYILEITAYDYAGNKVASSLTLTVISTAPTNANTNTEKVPEEGISNPLIPEVITELLPEAVQELIRDINKIVQEIRQNKTISEVVKNIIQPTTTTAAIVAATGVAATSAGLELFNMIYLFFRFGYFWLVPVSLGKRRKPWGIVFDSTTGKPVRRAIVRLFSKEFNKLRESQITDAEGRFGFLVDPGEYFVAVERRGFLFPSMILKSSIITMYDNIYRGNIFTVKERREGVLNLNIPVDPEIREVTRERLLWLRFLNILGVVLERLNMPLLLGGLLISWAAAVVQPTLFNNIILLFYGLLIILKGIILRRMQRSWGVVTDHLTGSPIQYAVVRIYNVATGTVTGTRVTSSQGQFTALVSPGQYYTVVAKAGYHTFQSKPVEIRKKHGLIKMAVQLMSLTPTTTAAGSVINLEPMENNNTVVSINQKAKLLGSQAEKRQSSPFTPPPLKDVIGPSTSKNAKNSEKRPVKDKK